MRRAIARQKDINLQNTAVGRWVRTYYDVFMEEISDRVMLNMLIDPIEIVKKRVRVQRWRQRMEEDRRVRKQRQEMQNPSI